MGLVLAHPTALAMANDILEQKEISGLVINDFKRGENRDIFKALQLWTAMDSPAIDSLIEMVDDTLAGQLAILADFWHRNPPASIENVNRDLSIAILRLRLQNVVEQIKELTFLQREAIENNDLLSARQFTTTAETYSQERRKLEHTRDALSLMGKRRAETKFN